MPYAGSRICTASPLVRDDDVVPSKVKPVIKNEARRCDPAGLDIYRVVVSDEADISRFGAFLAGTDREAHALPVHWRLQAAAAER
jgi:hypothetical protein